MKPGNVQFAVLGLIASKPEGIHGYALKGECEAISDAFWSLNYGKLYRILDLLESSGELDVADQIQQGRPNRKVYRITERGRRTLDDWLLSPLTGEAQPLRDELVLKLLFLGAGQVNKVCELIKQQRGIYLTRLARISRRRRRLAKAGVDMKASELVLDGAEMRVRADISWLDHVERALIKGHFGSYPSKQK